MSEYLGEVFREQVERTARWRRERAKQFPDDTRNKSAAETLERLAVEIHDLNGSELEKQIREAMDKLEEQLRDDADNCRDFNCAVDINETVSEKLRSIGFGATCTVTKFLEWYRDLLNQILRDRAEGTVSLR